MTGIYTVCASDDCDHIQQLDSVTTVRRELETAGWSHERHDYDTAAHWYCGTHRQTGTPS